MTPITPTATGVRLVIHVQPRASKTEVVGRHGDAIKLRIKAPPVDGAANAEVIRFVAKALGLPSRQVHMVHGDTSRRKTIEATGISVADATAALGV
jgi:uncharacterized protein (TIGR00251 family)